MMAEVDEDQWEQLLNTNDSSNSITAEVSVVWMMLSRDFCNIQCSAKCSLSLTGRSAAEP